MNSPQPPLLELPDEICSNQGIFKAKLFNKCPVKGPLNIIELRPHFQHYQTKIDKDLFRLEAPQPPLQEIEDAVQKCISRIRIICEPIIDTEHVKVSRPIFKLTEDENNDKIDVSSLLTLDPPQSPLIELPDDCLKPEFKIRTFIHIRIDQLSSQKPVADNIHFGKQLSVFRLVPPQPPQIEVEDTANSIMYIEKSLEIERFIHQIYSIAIPPVIPAESVIFPQNWKPSSDLQRPEVDINDRVNLSISEPKIIEENENILNQSLVIIPPQPLITSVRADKLERSPPPEPPIELSDTQNSIRFCKKNYQKEEMMPSTNSFQFLQPESYSDILLRLVFRMSPPPAYDPTDDVIDIINKLETRRELKMMDRDEELTEVINYSITSASDIFHVGHDGNKKRKNANISIDRQHRKLSPYVKYLVCEIFCVEPPQLDLDYLEIKDPVSVKKTGDIFDDVKFYRKPFR